MIKTNWTTEEVLALAPDEGTKKRGQSTAKANKWQTLEKNDRAIWGTCKGSGKEPYRTGVDWIGPAFKCSCPVRKPPCKHVMALMLLSVAENFATTTPPQWMSEWLDKRAEKRTKVVEIPTVSKEEAEKKAAARQENFDKRIALMQNGFMELEIWLNDLIRQGIASVEKQSYSFWTDVAAKMVDAKAKGASNFIKEIPLLINVKPDWYETVLARLADVYTLTQAFKNIKKLPTPLQHDVLSVGGYTIPSKDLLENKGVTDVWEVLGKVEGVGTDESILFRRVWLKGLKTEQYALILDFAHINFGFTDTWMVGSAFHGELVYFPSNYPSRAKVKTQEPLPDFVDSMTGAPNISALLDDFSKAVAQNPWLMDFPCMLNNVIPVIRNEKLELIDNEQNIIPVIDKDFMGWKLIALSGGEPISIFGEWTGQELMPLSAITGSQFVSS